MLPKRLFIQVLGISLADAVEAFGQEVEQQAAEADELAGHEGRGPVSLSNGGKWKSAPTQPCSW